MNGTLNDWHVVLLRQPRLAKPLYNAILEQGGGAQILPPFHCVSTHSSSFSKQWQESIAKADFLFVVSANAVYSAPMGMLQAIQANQHLLIVTMGEATTQALQSVGITAALTAPPGSTSEDVLQLPFLQENIIKGTKSVIVAGEDGRDVLANTLKKRQACVDVMKVYRLEQAPIDLTPYLKHWHACENTVLVVMSVAALNFFLDSVPHLDLAWIKDQHVVVISERLAEHAKKCAFKHIFVAKGGALAPVLETLKEVAQSCHTGDRSS